MVKMDTRHSLNDYARLKEPLIGLCDNTRVSEQETASNLAARALFEAALASDLANARTMLAHIPFAAAEAIRVWATQRGVPLDSVEEHGGILEYGGRALYCFRFGVQARHNGVVCVDADGTVLAEDSRVSLCPSS